MEHHDPGTTDGGDPGSEGRPLPAMIAVYPLALLLTAPIYDIVGLASGSAVWFAVSFWMILTGVVGGLTGAALRLGDRPAAARGNRSRSTGLLSGPGGSVVVALFVLSWALRCQAPEAPPSIALTLSFSGIALALLGRGRVPALLGQNPILARPRRPSRPDRDVGWPGVV